MCPIWSARRRLKTENQPDFRNKIVSNYLNEERIERFGPQKGVLKPETTCFSWFLHDENVATKDSSLDSVSLQREKRFWV